MEFMSVRFFYDRIALTMNNKMTLFKTTVFTIIDLGACVYQKQPLRKGPGKDILAL